MKKQLVYPDFISRVFCSTFDIMIIALFTSCIDHLIRKPLCLLSLQNIITLNNLNTNNIQELEQFFSNYRPESQSDIQALLLCKFVPSIIESILVGIYTIFFWLSYAKTPAKFIMQMKIVDRNTLEKPSKSQFIKRLFAMALYPIGVWFALFNKKRQTLHDIIAGTCVIKS